VSSEAPPSADGWDIASFMQGGKSQAVAWDLVNELLWSLSDSVSKVHWRYGVSLASTSKRRVTSKHTLGLMEPYIPAVKHIHKHIACYHL